MRPSRHQLESLADFLMFNPGIAKGLLRTAHAKQETKRKWDEISISLNAMGGTQKSGQGWAKYWADKKCALKKICAQRALSRRLTGGGAGDHFPLLSPLDEKLVSVMGGPEFAAGDSQLAVDPFPSSEPASSHNAVSHAEETDNTQLASPIQNMETVQDPISQASRERSPVRTPAVRTRSRTMLDLDRDRFAAIERERVEAENVTARALQDMSNNMANICTAVDGLSAAIREGAQTLANALLTIAESLKQ